ncbi:MAG TPA: 4-(cytidine 5'-diphospho)-2-C-methyl-D-erythritol kinase [Candidatus Koribacter sp.]|jgi:4-diphosphocytidyl-2-C-methyl-D-erythritol kinase
MRISAKSYAKINLGLQIDAKRPDGFHGLRTLYTTIALHDLISVEVADATPTSAKPALVGDPGFGITVRCDHPDVPCDSTNTCYKAAERVLRALDRQAKVGITIDKRLPVQGGLGAGSSNAVATILALEKALKSDLNAAERARIAAEIGSDLNLFLYGGLTLGTGRGEEVWPLEDLPSIPLVVVTPEVGVSTAKAFEAWDQLSPQQTKSAAAGDPEKLTANQGSATMNMFNHAVYAWLGSTAVSGVPALSGDRVEALLLDLVRTGISNDFERVVFPEIPVLREVKCALEREGAAYAAMSGSGSTLYGLFRTAEEASQAASRLNAAGMKAVATRTLPRSEYWRGMFEGQ